MKSLLLTLMVVGLGLTAAADDTDLTLLKRLLAALKERQDVTLAKRNSYGIIWLRDRRTVNIYPQKTTGCKDPCPFTIRFTGKGQTSKDALDVLFREKRFKDMYVYPEAKIMRSVITTGNQIGQTTLPRQLRVTVCMIDGGDDEDICNTREIDTTKKEDAVFHKTVEGPADK